MPDTRVRSLTAEQSVRLLSARRAVPAGLPADLVLRHAAAYLGSILGATVIFAGWRDGHWSILAQAGPTDLHLPPSEGDTLEEIAETLDEAVAVRIVDGAPWTLAQLPAVAHSALLLIEGDWSESTHALAEAARALCAPDGSSTSL